MKIITFDGSKIFSINREKGGEVNIYLCENDIGLKVGQIHERRTDEDLTAKCLAKIELLNEETYINLCRVLLSYATREDLVAILGNTIAWANYVVQGKERSKKNGKENAEIEGFRNIKVVGGKSRTRM